MASPEVRSSLKGKVALITGASSGIGAAAAVKLAQAGVRVGIAARRGNRLAELASRIALDGGEALPLETDIVDEQSVQTSVDRLLNAYGSLDILFGNAGVMPVSNIDEFKTDEWRQMVEVNINGMLNTVAAVLPQMIRQHAGHVVITSSIAGRRVFGPGYTVYSATKYAVSAFTEGLRMEMGRKHNIRVTSIQPGAVATELQSHTTSTEYSEGMAAYRKAIRFLDAADVADLLLFAVQAPAHVNVAELYVVPTEQV